MTVSHRRRASDSDRRGVRPRSATALMTAGVTALAVGALVIGCASTRPQSATSEVAKASSRIAQDAQAPTEVSVTQEPFIRALAIDYVEPERDGVSLRVRGAPLAGALESLARGRGYGVTFVGEARGDRPVTVELVNQTFPRAIREIALAGGYAAVIDERRRQIMVAEEATYFYRVPGHLLDRQTTSFQMQSSPGLGQAGTTGGAPTGTTAGAGAGAASGNSGGSANGGNTTITGSTVRSADQLIVAVVSLVGGNTGPGGSSSSQRVQFVPELGVLSVRANATQLRRISDLMETITRDAQYQVEVEVAFVEVSLTRGFSYGIDWQRVIPTGRLIGSGTGLDLSVSSQNIAFNPAVTASITKSSVTSVIRALESFSDVRVVAQPSAIARNNTDVLITRGRQVPYLGEISLQTSVNAGTTTSGKLSFVPDGTSVALRASVLDPNRVELRLAPQQTNAAEFREFAIGPGAKLVGPVFPLSQAYLQLVVEQGKTYVIGGLNLESGQRNDANIPGLADIPIIGPLLTSTSRTSERTQLVLLLTTRILPPPATVNSMIGESL